MNTITKLFATLGRLVAVALLFVSATAFVWQGAFFSNTAAVAAPGNPVLAATTDAGDKVQRENKGFVRDTAEKVKETASKNASRVERAAGDDGGVVERKAQRDAARIQQRADEDADRTQKAIDNNVNAIERTVDNIKDAFTK
ncbi:MULTISPECIES: hypothetical protein [unclassified Leptolyngbya]|uniref:hypothetical protein n=1 Tax=unclassified Leptolyngbya TaxID=2650499 RepID=UPI0016829426|nr:MULTISPECIES: hypothetical protein [unclassified Leptolyngbya]MBD1911718.1 hypothetical protein [Leptolyngbya sp. FACHB-8]MBD2155553.1 hypothetical protein [Leptolyngbya sp. FACHB-16]